MEFRNTKNGQKRYNNKLKISENRVSQVPLASWSTRLVRSGHKRAWLVDADMGKWIWFDQGKHDQQTLERGQEHGQMTQRSQARKC